MMLPDVMKSSTYVLLDSVVPDGFSCSEMIGFPDGLVDSSCKEIDMIIEYKYQKVMHLSCGYFTIFTYTNGR